jgi:arylsulfatase A-like enzyme
MKIKTQTMLMFTTAALTCTVAMPSNAAEVAKKPDAPQPPRPNFITILVDDAGFSDMGLFGSEVSTPNLDELANRGVILTNFYSAPTSTPARAMLFTGKDNHQAGAGNMAGYLRPEQKGKPGYEGILSLDVLPYQQVLKDNGYETVLVGKWDLGLKPGYNPFERGFTSTFALLPGGGMHYSQKDGTFVQTDPPEKVKGSPYSVNGKPLPKFPREFYSTDYYTAMALELLSNRDMSKPFALNLCYTAPHAPLQAPAEVTAKYVETYMKGWDVLRQERFERQKAAGFWPADTVLPPRNADAPAWDSLTPEQQKVEAKKMAIFAAMLETVDANVGRLVQYLKDSGQFDNTVFFFMSDNGGAVGASALSNPNKKDYLQANFDLSPENMGNWNSYAGYGKGWSMLSNTPFNLYKGDAFDGGIHTMAFVSYPQAKVAGIKSNCLHSIMDIAPTILDMAHVTYPDSYQDKPNKPMQGVSMAPMLNGLVYCDPERWIGWEMDGMKALRKGNWKLAQRWDDATGCYDPNWYLFNLGADPFERNDLAKQEPQKYQELLDLYKRYAEENGVIDVPNCPPPSASDGE